MAIIHIMKDGSQRESVEGLVISNAGFYAVLNRLSKKGTKNDKRYRDSRTAQSKANGNYYGYY